LHLLIDDRRSAGAGDGQPPRRGGVALNIDLQAQALARPRGGGQFHAADPHVRPIGQAAERHHVDRHAVRRRELRGLCGIAGVLAAIGE
jgi:hypothetical protein